MGPYKPLRTWVDFSHPLLYGNNRSLNPGTYSIDQDEILMITDPVPLVD